MRNNNLKSQTNERIRLEVSQMERKLLFQTTFLIISKKFLIISKTIRRLLLLINKTPAINQ